MRRVLLLLALVACRTPTAAWSPGPGRVGVNVLCGTRSTWQFAVDGVDAGTWAAQPPESRAQFATSGPGDHQVIAWELTPANILTVILRVRDGTVVTARCG